MEAGRDLHIENPGFQKSYILNILSMYVLYIHINECSVNVKLYMFGFADVADKILVTQYTNGKFGKISMLVFVCDLYI